MENSTQNAFGKFISSLFGFFEKSSSVIGVDVGSSSIKIVQLKKKGGKAILETYGELALGPYTHLAIGQAVNLSQEKKQEALIDIIREANITAHNGGFSIPLTSSLVFVMEMPEVSQKQLKEMVPIEARKYIPIPITEVTLDWSIIPEESDFVDDSEDEDTVPETSKARRKIKILVAAIQDNTIKEYQSLASKTGLNISFLEIETFSAIRSLLRRERTPVLIIDIGAGTTKLSIVENGVSVATHIINRGSQDMTVALSKSQGISVLKAEEIKREKGLLKGEIQDDYVEAPRLILNSIFTESNKMLLQYEKRYNKTISKVILSGGGSLLKGILEAAQKNFNTEVVHADPFSQIETPAFLESVLKDVGPNFAVSVGIALRKLQEME